MYSSHGRRRVQVKGALADVKKQLKEERGKREEAKAALISEQQYFASKLAELEAMTRGTAAPPQQLCGTTVGAGCLLSVFVARVCGACG